MHTWIYICIYIYIYIYKERLFGTETCAAWETLYNWMHTWIYIRIYIYIYIYKERLFGTETCAARETFCHVSAPHEKKKGFFQRVSLTRFSLCQRDSFKETLFERYTETCFRKHVAHERIFDTFQRRKSKKSLFERVPLTRFSATRFRVSFKKRKLFERVVLRVSFKESLWLRSKRLLEQLFQRVPLTRFSATRFRVSFKKSLSKRVFERVVLRVSLSEESRWKSRSKRL